MRKKQEIKRLAKEINLNFGEKDLMVTLAYSEIVEKAVLDTEVKSFIRRIKKHNKNMKYIYTAREIAPLHHNIIMSNVDKELILKNWSNGRIKIIEIKQIEELGEELARYLISEKNIYVRHVQIYR
ncbi:hypothetical protein FDF02_16995 [Clostridium botulinum]|nr:hypothetical protein [Clostridium botulinum]